MKKRSISSLASDPSYRCSLRAGFRRTRVAGAMHGPLLGDDLACNAAVDISSETSPGHLAGCFRQGDFELFALMRYPRHVAVDRLLHHAGAVPYMHRRVHVAMKDDDRTTGSEPGPCERARGRTVAHCQHCAIAVGRAAVRQAGVAAERGEEVGVGASENDRYGAA